MGAMTDIPGVTDASMGIPRAGAIRSPELPLVSCAGVPIAASGRGDAAHALVQIATSSCTSGVDVHLCNAYTLALADKEPWLKYLLCEATLNLPDGMGVVWANRLLNRGREMPRESACGPNLLLDTFDLGEEVGLRHYLLGSTPEVLTSLEAELRSRYPRAVIVGVESPPFRPLTEDEEAMQVARIADSGAQIVWVGIGTPKQDAVARALARQLPMAFVAVGAAFDFVAGHKKRPPLWMQRRGLEWTYRLATEPRRLWKRYLFGNARFIVAAAFSRNW
jgi:N-acetylglucosaminyldiphosphoundecaprenol N-acetyl-beta-D-mannosaminyltransferase